MDNKKLFKCMDEVRQQCRFGMLAHQQLRSALNLLDSEKIFLHVHSFLSHAGTISRLLWPERESSKPRGDQLRQELKVEEASPLHLREMALQLDREDERFEDWLDSLGDPNYVDMNVISMTAINEVQPDVFQRSLDPDTLKMELRGAGCDLKSINQEMIQLEKAVQAWIRTHNPW